MHTGDLIARISGAFVKYFRFDHNTVFLTGDGFDLSIMKEVEITNNICYNMNWQGGDTSGASEPNAFIKVDSLISLDGFTDADRTFKITNNNIFLEQKYIDVLSNGPFVKPIFCDTVCKHFIKSGQMDVSNNFSEELTFSGPPPAPMSYITSWHEHDGNLIGIAVPNFFADLDPANPGGEAEFTFNYNNNSRSATASKTNGPLGSSRWGLITGLEMAPAPATDFTFYPNPAQNKIYMTFGVVNEANILIEVYDISGTKVKSLNASDVSESSEVEIDISDLKTGVYVINIQLDNIKRGQGKLMIKK
jgi:hypothetical protein